MYFSLYENHLQGVRGRVTSPVTHYIIRPSIGVIVPFITIVGAHLEEMFVFLAKFSLKRTLEDVSPLGRR